MSRERELLNDGSDLKTIKDLLICLNESELTVALAQELILRASYIGKKKSRTKMVPLSDKLIEEILGIDSICDRLNHYQSGYIAGIEFAENYHGIT